MQLMNLPDGRLLSALHTKIQTPPRRLKHEGNTRMPAKEQTKPPAGTKAKHGCQRKGQNNQTARAAKAPTRMPAKTRSKPPSVADNQKLKTA